MKQRRDVKLNRRHIVKIERWNNIKFGLTFWLVKLNQWSLRWQITDLGETFLFFQGFLSQTLTIRRTAGEGRGPSFIPFYHFHPLTNIQIFICNFACEVIITYFQSQHLYLPGCYSMRFTILSNYHLIYWWCDVNFCLFTWWFDSSFFVTAI